MAASTVEQDYQNLYQEGLHLLAQQKNARTLPFVTIHSEVKEQKFIGRLAPIDDTDESFQEERHADTEWEELTHSRRRLITRVRDKAIPLDSADEVRMVTDPKNIDALFA